MICDSINKRLWTPILLPPVTDRVWNILDLKLRSLAAVRRSKMLHASSAVNCADALAYAYVAMARNEPKSAQEAVNCLNAVIERTTPFSHLGLYGGLAGLAWTVQHISNLPDDIEQRSGAPPSPGVVHITERADALLGDAIMTGAWGGGTNLARGIVGIGIYFLERLPAKGAVRGLEYIIDWLEQTANRNSHGISWRTDRELAIKWQHNIGPARVNCMGLLDGVSAIVHFLSEVSAHGIHKERCALMLDSSIEWLMAQPAPVIGVSRFAPWIAENVPALPSRLAWCEGDLGISLALLQAAHRHENPVWRRFAYELVDHCLAWPADLSGVVDSSLCHGAAGVAHLFNRLYHLCGDERCLQAARAWFDWTLSMTANLDSHAPSAHEMDTVDPHASDSDCIY